MTADVITLAPAKTPKTKIDNTLLVKAFHDEGGRIFHIRPHDGYTQPDRGMTVAYKKKSGRIEMATSVTHRNDTFEKKIGTKTAIEHFRAGQTVNLPVTDVESLIRMLSVIC